MLMFLAYMPVDEQERQQKLFLIAERDWVFNRSDELKKFVCPVCKGHGLYIPPKLWFVSCRFCFSTCTVDELLEAN